MLCALLELKEKSVVVDWNRFLKIRIGNFLCSFRPIKLKFCFFLLINRVKVCLYRTRPRPRFGSVREGMV